ncbi:MAG: nuclear transport factor 2 family protein [Planctomycetes bacterium]|nr:nuclear transport factor 2 family protein [Planctomycetota bacterium]
MKLLLALVLFTAACRAPAGDVASLLAADRAFCADARARGVDGWVAAFDERGSQVADDFSPITGHAAIRERMRAFFAEPANALVWEPDDARLSEAGNLGTTTGRWSVTRREPDGTVREVASGRYFDVWRKLPDGTWKLLYDVGDADPAR